jgi:bacillithiol biosynthesis cysteine-adding enzyme BshC
VYASLDMRRFPWIRPLVAAYATDFPSVGSLFAGDPASPAAWMTTIGRVTRAARDRVRLEALVSAQLARRDAPEEARASARRLADPKAVAIVTGQQAGLFGGPLYVLLKAVTALQLARRVERDHHIPAVPVFWVDAEDHDWDEVRSATVLDANLSPVSVSSADLPGAGRQPVASLLLDGSVEASLTALEQALGPSEFTSDTMALVRAVYRPGAGMAQAFAALLDRVLGRHGLVIFEGADPAAKPLSAKVFAGEIERPGQTATLAREAGERMARLGHAAQVEPADDTVALFYLDAQGRTPIRRRGTEFTIGDHVRSGADLRTEALTHPERFGPNVLLRPVVQDHLFPTVCFVGGPSELAYQAQLGQVYSTFGVEPPLLYSRASATLLDAAALKFLERSGIAFEALHARDDTALNRLLESQLPPDLDPAIAEAGRLLAEQTAALSEIVSRIDPTLAGVVTTTESRIRETLATLQGKIVQAIKRKDDTLRRQFSRTRNLAFPNGQPQEREIALPFFLNRYGLQLADRLIDALPLDTGKHHLLQL